MSPRISILGKHPGLLYCWASKECLCCEASVSYGHSQISLLA